MDEFNYFYFFLLILNSNLKVNVRIDSIQIISMYLKNKKRKQLTSITPEIISKQNLDLHVIINETIELIFCYESKERRK